LIWDAPCINNKRAKVIEEYIYVFFDKANNGLASTSSFDEFWISKYIDYGDKEAQCKCNNQNAPINLDQCLNQNNQG